MMAIDKHGKKCDFKSIGSIIVTSARSSAGVFVSEATVAKDPDDVPVFDRGAWGELLRSETYDSLASPAQNKAEAEMWSRMHHRRAQKGTREIMKSLDFDNMP